MTTVVAVDNSSPSTPSLTEAELQLDRRQDGGSMIGAGVDADINSSPLPSKQEDIVVHGSESRKVEDSGMQDHVRAIHEIDEFALHYIAEEIIIPPDLRQSLPSAVETLLSRLESSTSNDDVREIENGDLVFHSFGYLFGLSKELGMTDKLPRGWRAAIRLMVMTAVGRCHTLEVIRLHALNLSIQELKALLQPLRTSSALRELDLHGNSIVHTKEGCKVVADFMNVNRSIRILGLGKAEKKPYLHHYLAFRGHPTLEVLDLHPLDIQERSSIIRSCPKLQRMSGWEWEVEDDRTAMMYARFLIDHPSFRHVEVWGPAGPVSSFLLSLCTGAGSVNSLTGLKVRLTGDDQLPRNVLKRAILANRNLEHVYFQDVRISSEEWQTLFRSIKGNDVLKRLAVYKCFEEDERIDGRAWQELAWQELAALVKESSKLEYLDISNWNGYFHQPDLPALLEALTSNKSGIQEVQLEGMGWYHLTLDESQALVSWVENNVSLRRLHFYFDNPNWEEFFHSLRRNSALKTLYISSTNNSRDLEALLATLQVNKTLKQVNMDVDDDARTALVQYALQEKERHGVVTYAFVSTSTEDRPGLIRSLQHNPVLQYLYLFFEGTEEFDQMTWDELEALFKKSATLESLIIVHRNRKTIRHDLRILFELLVCTKNLTSFALEGFHVDEKGSQTLASFIQKNTSLEQLTLNRVRCDNWENIFGSLRYHKALQTLKLEYISSLDDGAFKELLGVLQVHSALENIFLEGKNWDNEGKGAIIREALEQKRRRQTYMDGMSASLGQEQFRVPSTGRLFLCGSARAGKTQLRIALTDAAKHRTDKGCRLGQFFPRRTDLRRTHGIEIQMLKINSLEISIWDLAGQTIFRALQDVLFPKLNLACVFLFVFSPFNPDTNCLKVELIDELRRELLPWLRFISSNSQIGLIVPQVKIVISHRDKIDHELLRLGWARNVINNLRLQFASILDIDENIFCTNSTTSGQDVDDILDHTVNSIENLLKDKVFNVPSTCLTLGSVLAKPGRYSPSPPNSHLYKKRFPFSSSRMSFGNALASRATSKTRETMEPILPTAKFFELCRSEVPSLERFNYSDEEGRTVLTAIAKYLHDAGNIIHLVKSDLVVVDPNWFTFSFLGRLIGEGHDFQRPLVVVDRYKRQTDGLVSTEAFEELLHNVSDTLRGEGYKGMHDKLLKKVLEELDFCFEVRQAGGYFAPAIFAEERHKRSAEGLRKLAAWECVADMPNTEREIIFVGVRLQCRDRLRSSLTPSFFPRFQVKFRNRLISDCGLRPDQVSCDYNMIHFLMEDYEVYVESDGLPGDRIDILVRSPTSRTNTVQFIQKNIVREMEDFCRSCCPGVALVVGVLRTECVEKLTLSAHRSENQSILIEDLKEKWKEYILTRDVHSVAWDEEHVANYRYMWPSNTEARLEKVRENAKDLLTQEDYLEVLQSVKGVAVSKETELEGLKAVEEEIDKEIEGRSPSDGSERSAEGSSASQQSTPSAREVRSQDRTLRRGYSDLMIGHAKTQYAIQMLGHKVDEFREEVKDIMKGIRMDVKTVQQYQQKILATRVNIDRKLNQLLHVTDSFAKSGVPNRPYLTTDAKWSHRITAEVSFGRAMMLHFMCEDRNKNHIVDDQPGFPIMVSKENKEALRFLSVTAIKVLWYLLKAGVHVATSLGTVVPDLEVGEKSALLTVSTLGTLLTSLLEPGNVEQRNIVESQNKFDQTNLDRGCWQYLKQLFSNSLEGRCPEYFLLYNARYENSPQEPSQAWLCKACIEKGRERGEIVV